MRTSVPIAFMLALSTAIGCGLGGRNPAGNNNGDNGGNNGSNGNNGNNGNGNNGNNGNNGPVTPTVVLAPGAPMDAASQFGGADNPALAAMIVYPPDGVLIPPNLNELEVQFTPVAATKLYEVAFAGASLDLRIYTPCNAVGNGCSLTPDAPTWILLSSAARSQTITVTVRATDGTGVGTSAPHKLSFGDDDIDGGLYYWAASTGAINRYDFGLRGQKAEAFYTPAQAGGITQCVGCHALSQNGARIAVGLNAPGEEMRILDVATRTTLYDESFMSFMGNGLPSVSVFEALAPDGSRIVTVEGGGLTLRDGGTGALVGAMPALANATMPDVSPDGKRVVYTRDGSGLGNLFAFGNPEVMQGTLLVASLGATTITNEKPLVPSGGE